MILKFTALLLAKYIPLRGALPAPPPKLADMNEIFDTVNEKYDGAPLTNECGDCIAANLHDGKGISAVYDIPVDGGGYIILVGPLPLLTSQVSKQKEGEEKERFMLIFGCKSGQTNSLND